MIVARTREEYRALFPQEEHFFLSDAFVSTVASKVSEVLYLTSNTPHCSIGLIVGVKENRLLSPFSAPFGGFHYGSSHIENDHIQEFLEELQHYIKEAGLKGIRVTLAPDLYMDGANEHILAAADAAGLTLETPEITSWVNLQSYDGRFSARSANKAVRLAQKQNLQFSCTQHAKSKRLCYDIIKENRARQNRPLFMSFEELLAMEHHLDVDYFLVKSDDGVPLAAAILYHVSATVIMAVFWGDAEIGRPVRAMDFLIHNLYMHYKSVSMHYLDMGISTEQGVVNEGLLSFKERHNAVSSPRHTLIWDTK